MSSDPSDSNLPESSDANFCSTVASSTCVWVDPDPDEEHPAKTTTTTAATTHKRMEGA